MEYDSSVEHLQRMLNHLGHDTGTVDGLRGPATNDGIATYIRQDMHELEEKFGTAALQDKAATIDIGRIARHAVRDLLANDKQGLDKPQIKALEEGLNSLGYITSNEPAAGEMHPELARAITEFRDNHPGLDPPADTTDMTARDDFQKASYGPSHDQFGPDPLNAGIQNFVEKAHDQDMGYELAHGFNAPADSEALNCSGFVYHAIKSGLERAAQTSNFQVDAGAEALAQTYAANQVKQIGDNYGGIIREPAQLEAGMVIGLDTGEEVEDWRFANIDHAAVTFRNDEGEIMVAESNSYYDGIRITPADAWLAKHQDDELYAADFSPAVKPEPGNDPRQVVQNNMQAQSEVSMAPL